MADPDPGPPPPPPPEPIPIRVGEVDQSIDDDNESDDDFLLAEDNDIPIAPMLPMPRPRGPIDVSVGGRSRSIIFNDRVWRFSQNYTVSSVSHLETRGSQNWEILGKLILPPSALRQLSRNSNVLMSPMLFKATNPTTQKFTHCGVQEFVAEEDYCHMPSWMMRLLGLEDGNNVRIERVELPIATFAKFQPQSTEFLEISNPKAILESSFRYFACLTKGDIIAIHYNNRIYELLVLELEPSSAVSIIECDMNVDFAPPVGYVSPSNSDEGVEGGADMGFEPFQGKGNRLNGKLVIEEPGTSKKTVRGMPDTEWKIGSLNFKRYPKRPTQEEKGGGEKRINTFGGEGKSLRRQRPGADQVQT